MRHSLHFYYMCVRPIGVSAQYLPGTIDSTLDIPTRHSFNSSPDPLAQPMVQCFTQRLVHIHVILHGFALKLTPKRGLGNDEDVTLDITDGYSAAWVILTQPDVDDVLGQFLHCLFWGFVQETHKHYHPTANLHNGGEGQR